MKKPRLGGPARGYYTATVPAHSGVGRVSAVLRKGLVGLPDLGEYVFDYDHGSLELREGESVRKVASGVTGFRRNAFYLSFFGRVPKTSKGFIDNQNLAFLRLPNCGLCVYDLFYLTHPDNISDRLLGKLLYQGMGNYPFYLAISQYTKNLVCEAFKVLPERVHAVPLDCDRQIFRPQHVDRDAFLLRLGLPTDRRYLLHVSSGDKRKNYLRILEAFGLISPLFPAVDLVRVGRSLHPDNLHHEQELIRNLGMKGRTHHLEGLSDVDLSSFYNVADAFVFPSLAEGFGLPVLEAQSSGCPCVTSKTTALAEVAGPLCTTVNPFDVNEIAAGMESVLRDPERRLREALASSQFLERFHWDEAQRLLREWMT